jgi:hypothetical protein
MNIWSKVDATCVKSLRLLAEGIYPQTDGLEGQVLKPLNQCTAPKTV